MAFQKPRQTPSRGRRKQSNRNVLSEVADGKSSESIFENKEPEPSWSTLPKKRKVKREMHNVLKFADSDEEPFHDDSISDSDFCESVLSDGVEGHFPASEWKYEDLQNIGIFYEDEPESFTDFMETVQGDILKKFPQCSNVSENVGKFSQLLKENVDFSYELESIRDFRKHMYKNKVAIEEKIIQDIQSNIEKSVEAEKNLDLKDMLSRQWLPAVKRFAYQTMKLIKKTLYPLEEGVTSRNFIQHFCSIFGQLFFLEPDAVKKKTFFCNGKTVDSIPDLSYSLHLKPFAGVTDVQDTILSVMEVMKTPIRSKSEVSLEDLVGTRVMGLVGSELFAETNFSVFKPNSLGIICMETMLIFLYLRMPEEHAVNVHMGGPLKTKGKISYTKPFDILNAEDRATIAEFLYLLGFIQNWHVC